MEDKNVGLLLAAFVMIILGVALIGVIASQTQSNTVKKYASNESHAVALNAGPLYSVNLTNATLTYAPTGWEKEDCPITNLVIKNVSGASLTLTTDYTFNSVTGIYTMVNSTTSMAAFNTGKDNNTYADYRYCGDDYLNSSFGRTTLDLVPGFFAIALLLIGVGLAFSVLKNEGLINI